MATSEIQTQIELNKVAQILNFDIFGFNGFTIPPERISDRCSTTFEQTYGDRLTRDDLAIAISTAEEMIEDLLGFNMFPRYEVNTLYTPRGSKPFTRSWTMNLQAEKGYLIDVAKEKRDFLGTIPVIRVDNDNDGFEEVATLDLTNWRTINPEEIHVFYQGTKIEIRQITVKDDGENRTVETQIYNIGKWSRLNAVNFEPLDYTDPDSYETELDVYHIYPDKTTPVRLYRFPNEVLDNLECNDDDCLPTFTDVCGYPTHKKFGYFTHKGTIPPEKLDVNIYSGWPSKNGKLDRRWEIPIVALAVSLITKNTGCYGDNENSIMSKWQQNILEANPNVPRVVIENIVMDSLGVVTFGSLLTSKVIKQYRLWNR